MRRLLAISILVLAIAMPSAGAGAPASRATRILFSAAFVSNDPILGEGPDRQIYSLEPSGRGIAELTFGATPSSSPLPSPDGRFVLFSRAGALWIMRPDGRGQRRLAAGTDAAWTPDSKRIAYVVLDARLRPLAIRLVSADGSGDRLLTRGPASSLAWSPDGRSLAFARGGSLRIVYDGKQQTIVRSPESGPLGQVAWSPYGRWLAYEQGEYGQERVSLIHPDGSHRRGVGPGSAPAWAPNGRMLAYLDSSHGVVVLDLATWERRPLRPPYPYFDPYTYDAWLAWSPTGSAIAYAKSYGYEYRIWILGLAGGARLLTASFPQPEGLAWSTSSGVLRYRPAVPLGPIATADELRVRAPIDELAVDGDRVAVGFCDSIAVWTPASRSVAQVLPEIPPLCIYEGHSVYSLALAGERVGWGVVTGGCCPATSVLVKSLATGGTTTVADSGRTRGPDRDRTGWVLGAGDTLVFSSRKICEDYPPPTGPTCAVLDPSQRPVLSQTIWRIREPSYQGLCPYSVEARTPAFRPGPCQELATEPGSFVPSDVDSGRVVAVGENAVVVLDQNGTRLLAVPVKALAAQLSGSDLVVLLRGELRDYDATTGALLHVSPLPDVPSGGVCGADCGSTPRLRLEDAAHGLAAYILDGRVHLLRLRDGADAVLAEGTAARFGASGLFYAYEAPYPWRGRIRFRPFDQLPLR